MSQVPATGSSAAAIERLRRTLVGITALAIAAALARTLADVAILVFAAALAGTILRGGAERFGKLVRLRAGAALTIILVGLMVLAVLAVWLRGPALVAEGFHLYGEIRRQVAALRGELGRTPWGLELVRRTHVVIDNAGSHAAGLISGFASGTIGALGSLLLLLVAALYFAASPGLYVRGTLRLLPPERRERGAAILAALAHSLRWWFVGQACDMVVVGLLTAIGLAVLGVPLAGTLGVVAGLCNFVPYIGALAGAVPAILIALGQGPMQALSVAGLFLVVQTLEGNVIAPTVQRRTVELPPVLTIFSQTVLGALFGPLGLILATPMTAAAMVLVRKIYIEELLGDRSEARLTTGTRSAPDDGHQDCA